MKKAFTSFVAAALAIGVVGMGCGDNPASSLTGTFPTGGADGANEAVTSTNAGTVWAGFNTVYARVIGAGTSALASPKPVAAKALKKVTINGLKSGTATFDGSYSASSTKVDYNAKIEFNNFSDDNEQFYQGSLTWKLSTTLSPVSVNGEYSGTLNIQGNYKATLKYDIDITNNVPGGSIEITSNGETFTYDLSP